MHRKLICEYSILYCTFKMRKFAGHKICRRGLGKEPPIECHFPRLLSFYQIHSSSEVERCSELMSIELLSL